MYHLSEMISSQTNELKICECNIKKQAGWPVTPPSSENTLATDFATCLRNVGEDTSSTLPWAYAFKQYNSKKKEKGQEV